MPRFTGRRLCELAVLGVIGLLVFVVMFPWAIAVGGKGGPGQETDFAQRRRAMVATQIEARGVKDPAVLEAMRNVPRHRFVPTALAEMAYEDTPLPIGKGQTISQPYIVALMTELVHPKKTMKVLEIGTGSGYQAAVLGQCVAKVDTIEYVSELGKRAMALLKTLGYRNIHVRIGDGFDGWPEQAPFDAIIVTAAPEKIPQPLLDQLKLGGRLVAPVGGVEQDLVIITKTPQGNTKEVIPGVRFVPMTGKAQEAK